MSLLSAVRRLMPADLQGMVWSSKWAARMVSSTAGVLEPAEPKPVALSKLKDSFNDGTSISYLEELEEKYQKDPSSVDKSWATFFRNMGERRGLARAAFVSLLSLSNSLGLRRSDPPPMPLHRPWRVWRGHGRGFPCF